MSMVANQNQAQAVIREEERVLGVSFERAIAMTPKLIKDTVGIEAEALGDGYYVATIEEKGGKKREITVKLGRQGADTRFSVRVESFAMSKMIVLFIAFAMVTMGVGLIAALPWLISEQRKEARKRELMVHKMFRAIEDAVAEQGVSTNYRVAPGADANVQAEEETAAGVEEAAASQAAGRAS